MTRVFALLSLAALAAGCSFPEYAQQEPVPVATCRDGLLNGGELVVDCGPGCDAGCDKGQGCTTNDECASGLCNAGMCRVPSCSDGLKDRTESDVDCGGIDGCQACNVGQLCATVADCNGGSCNTGRCQAPTCSDGLQNQDESDVDCGGAACDRCQTKQHCSSDADCDKSQCSQGRCQAAGCEDGVKNGDESAKDCGGSCVPCPDFMGCNVTEDCQSLVCNPQARICLAATCQDGVLNADESAVDCGKSCDDKCNLTQDCKVAADCQSGACSDGRCVPASPTNMTLPRNGWIASAAATFSAETIPQRAIDGNNDTLWTSGVSQVPGLWFQVDMQRLTAFFRIDLICVSNGDYPRSIRVLISDDGQTFTPITGTIAGEPNLHLDFGKARVARYIKLETQQDTGGLWWRIDEMRVIQ